MKKSDIDDHLQMDFRDAHDKAIMIGAMKQSILRAFRQGHCEQRIAELEHLKERWNTLTEEQQIMEKLQGVEWAWSDLYESELQDLRSKQ